MAHAKGFLTIAGFKKESTYGTPVAVGAGEGFEFNNEGIAADVQLVPDELISGSPTQLEGSKGNEFYAGDFNTDVRYEGLETIVACAMGTAGSPAQEGTDDAYKHTLKIGSSLEGIFGTTVFWMQGLNVREYVSCKVNTLEFSIRNGERMKVTVGVIAHALNINTSSGTNTTTTAASITLPTNRNFLEFAQAQVLLNDYSGATLASGTDDVYISEMTLRLDNKMAADDVTTQYGYLIDEPLRDGFMEVSGSLVFSKYGTNNMALFADGVVSKTRKKVTVEFTGPLADGTSYFSWKMWLPNVQLSDGSPNVGGPQRVGWTANFAAKRCITAPSGFDTGFTEPVAMEIINQNNADALA